MFQVERSMGKEPVVFEELKKDCVAGATVDVCSVLICVWRGRQESLIQGMLGSVWFFFPKCCEKLLKRATSSIQQMENSCLQVWDKRSLFSPPSA